MIQVTKVWWDGDRLMAEPIDPATVYKDKPKFQPLTTEEVREAWDASAGAKDRLKAFYDGMDDRLWRKNKLRQYKEKPHELP